MPADPAPVLREIRHLPGVTVRFWQDQLERTMAIGQAITLCRSPQEAVRLQIAYAQASLASGLEHACRAGRLSQDIARDAGPSTHAERGAHAEHGAPGGCDDRAAPAA